MCTCDCAGTDERSGIQAVVEGYGDVLIQMDDVEAIEIFGQYFAQCEGKLGWANPRTLLALQNLCIALTKFGAKDEIERLRKKLEGCDDLPPAALGYLPS